MGLALALLFLVFFPILVIPDAQGDALVALKISLKASEHQLSDWNPNQVNPCTWSNVICDNTNSVTSVSLSSMNFTGFLTPKISVLKSLSTFTLQGSLVSGVIPDEFGNLTSLINLNLENNCLYGEIPSSLGNLQNLQFLILSQNNLSGSIPDSLTGLPKLMNVRADSNNLTGQVPSRLFQISQYNYSGNHLNCGVNYIQQCESRDEHSRTQLTLSLCELPQSHLFTILL